MKEKRESLIDKGIMMPPISFGKTLNPNQNEKEIAIEEMKTVN